MNMHVVSAIPFDHMEKCHAKVYWLQPIHKHIRNSQSHKHNFHTSVVTYSGTRKHEYNMCHTESNCIYSHTTTNKRTEVHANKNVLVLKETAKTQDGLKEEDRNGKRFYGE